MLSDDKIIELIHIKTYAYLSLANYSALRQHCLEQQALSVILEQVRNHIDQLVENAKEEYLATQMPLACEQQRQQDIEENRRDTEEAELEKRLNIKLVKELANINDELELARREKSKQEEILANLSPLIKTLTQQIRQLGTAKSSHEHSHVHGHSENEGKNIYHEHGQHQHHTSHEHQSTNQVHNHSHSVQAVAHKELIAEVCPVPAEVQSQLLAQKELMETQHSEARKKLEDCLDTIQKLAQRQNELNTKLSNEIPQKQQDRRERFSARQSREWARLNQESIQAQLSPQNYSLLMEQIRKFNALKETQGKQAVAKAEKLSYREYLYCLKNSLKTNQKLSLSFSETTALEQIAQFMQENLSVADEENNKLSRLKSELHAKWDLDNALSNREEQLLGLQRANPMLTNQNSRFDEDNKRLTQTISERLQDRNQLLKIGAGVLLLTLITALLAFIGGLELIFFTPSALCATATLGLFVTSLIYTAKNNSDRHQFKHNQISIEANSRKISAQTEQINTLEKTTIPELKILISQAHSKVDKLRQEIEDLKKMRQLLIGKANKVILNKIEKIYPIPSTSATADLEECSFTSTYNSKSETDGNSPLL
ncbi:MAG: hypothetical protein P4L79_05240 [Legionella sp.]|uniref:hypothetical protein n=1 Tax=Legionella sp. TaxID=459 RepID=UPI00284BAEBE|nr:hypothetical protein [Legionella sp.]